jgi:hypothetical protein
MFALDRQIVTAPTPNWRWKPAFSRASPSSASSIRLDGGIPLRRRREHCEIDAKSRLLTDNSAALQVLSRAPKQ